ncbi:hypothetical protein [Fundidesulfovibrio soli]|uniref:hypothetical protein n=1 Tax=Fundidesulfovibrio soli TaxID=2922716 RepID=UPI001FAECA5C|nr:hypothetical protein [Fundidesulfovibrio soli]
MIGRVDVNMQALGALTYAVDTSARNVAPSSAANHIPLSLDPPGTGAFVESARPDTTAYGETTGIIPAEAAYDHKLIDQAWRTAAHAGDVSVERGMAATARMELALRARVEAWRSIEQTTGAILRLIA